MPREKLCYEPGSWFAIPLEGHGFGIGLVANAGTQGKVIQIYLFGRAYNHMPTANETKNLTPEEAIWRPRVSDLGLVTGKWKVLGKHDEWRRADWAMPTYIMKDNISRRAVLRTYSPDFPARMMLETAASVDAVAYEEDGIGGRVFVERKLLSILTGKKDHG